MGAVVVQAACREELGWRFGRRARTLNISSMVETLVVSKLSGWLNSSALCRVARTAYEAHKSRRVSRDGTAGSVTRESLRRV